ncbi:MAG: hypothetical protein HY554_12105 [Elusimicrobia bacterium]|nr:hypothetical protein [Elusimicrobiota bacterium]
MKYMQSGGFQHHPLMRRTLGFTFLFMAGLWVTNFAMYFSRMGLSPSSVAAYYRGSEAEFIPARSAASMLEVTHTHLAMMGLVVLLLTHLAIFAPYSDRSKAALITAGFLSALIEEGSGWLVRFVDPGFAWLKIASFLSFQAVLAFLLATLAAFVARPAPPRGHAHRTAKPDLV